MTKEEALKILGLNSSSMQEDLALAYRNLSKKNHPDLNPGVDTSKQQEINEAYNYLKRNNSFSSDSVDATNKGKKNNNQYEDVDLPNVSPDEYVETKISEINEREEKLKNFNPNNKYQEIWIQHGNEELQILEGYKVDLYNYFCLKDVIYKIEPYYNNVLNKNVLYFVTSIIKAYKNNYETMSQMELEDYGLDLEDDRIISIIFEFKASCANLSDIIEAMKNFNVMAEKIKKLNQNSKSSTDSSNGFKL